jgi:hypothetical protein
MRGKTDSKASKRKPAERPSNARANRFGWTDSDIVIVSQPKKKLPAKKQPPAKRAKKKSGIPPAVLKEWSKKLDAYMEQWEADMRAAAAEYERETGDLGEPIRDARAKRTSTKKRAGARRAR